jgi:glycosyltransferase involved in cell wall biosynthesis
MGAMSSTAFLKISVIIANYNYGRFVGRAIESALALDWPDVEVIVVDDGSTDDSREVISRYESRGVKTLFQANSSQRVARNRGYEVSSGDVIIHLDSDDVLYSSLAQELASVWRPGVSKVQFQMMRIDENDRPLASVFPEFPVVPTSAEVRAWATRTSAYPTPPGSGNAYSREFLDKLFPVDDSCGPATDSALLAAAPFLGDVVTVAKPLVGYRIHGDNVSNLVADPERFPNAVERARARYQYTVRVARELPEAPEGEEPLFRSRHLLQLRIAARRLRPERHPLPHDSWTRMALDTFRSPFWPGPERLSKRVKIAGWSLATLMAPNPMAGRLISWRYGQRR